MTKHVNLDTGRETACDMEKQMALTISNPTYLTTGPTKSGQVLAPNELTGLEQAFLGTATITLDGTVKTGTINFIDGTQTVFATGNAAGTTVAPRYVEAAIVGSTVVADAEAISVNTGTPTTTGFPFYLTAAGTSGTVLTVLFTVYK
jgi:hypothetical protein